MDLFPIKATPPDDSSGWLFVTSLLVVVVNLALWFVFAIVIAKAVQIGWHL